MHMAKHDPNDYLFIDGGYLRECASGVGARFYGEPIDVDIAKVSQGYRRTFYYDCPPDTEGSAKTQALTDFESRMAEIGRLPGVHVFRGVLTGRRKQQKQVDVRIAVDMLSHTLNRNMASATLLAGDQDFVPVLDALVRAGMYVSLLYERISGNTKLIRAADEATEITPRTLEDWASDAFLATHRLPTIRELGVFDIEDRCGTVGASPKWEVLCFGLGPSGLPMRVCHEPTGVYTAWYALNDTVYRGHTHRDGRFLKNYLEQIGLAYEVTKSTDRYESEVS
jgi:uncharacterized LabA/DUF88 family protein